MLLPAVHAFVHGALLLSAEHAGQTGYLLQGLDGFLNDVSQLRSSDDVWEAPGVSGEVLVPVGRCG